MMDLQPSSLEDIELPVHRFIDRDRWIKYRDMLGKEGSEDHSLRSPDAGAYSGCTYGCMVYQEQVMQIVRDLAGFSMGQSDNIRRAMSKKKASIMEKYRTLFIHGGLDELGRNVTAL